MKSFITLSLLLGSVAVFSAQRTVSSQTTTTTINTSTSSQWNMSVGPQLSLLPDSGETGFGMNAAFGKRISNTAAYIGAEIGFTFWGNFFDATRNTDGAIGSKTAFYIMPSATYEFNQGQTVNPYIGVSTGAYLNMGGMRTDALFAMMVRPGLNINLTNALAVNLESKFGVLDRLLIVAPQAGFNFYF